MNESFRRRFDAFVAYGPDLFYHCLLCRDLLPTEPQPHAIACHCGNIILDWDGDRIAVRDETKADLKQIRR